MPNEPQTTTRKRRLISKAKGRRREYRARDILETDGFAVTRAAGSLGVWDLVGVRRDPEPDNYLPVVLLVQAKSARWPRSGEWKTLEADAGRYDRTFVSCEVWRFRDGETEPEIRVIE